MNKKNSLIRKVFAVLFAVGLTLSANAGSWIVYVRMYDNTVITLDLPSIPTPDASGLYRLHVKDRGDIIVHVSNVWIVEKTNKAKSKK